MLKRCSKKKGFDFKNIKHIIALALLVAGLYTVEATQTYLEKTNFSDDVAESMNSVLVAELNYNLGNSEEATSQYLDLALKTDDVKIVERATEIAARSSQLASSLILAERWVILSPKSLDARQYLSLLLLRNNQFKKSSKQLHTIYQLQEKKLLDAGAPKEEYKSSLKFIASMLFLESHHEKALKAFNSFYNTYQYAEDLVPNQAQLLLIQASLASKAKDYALVLEAIDHYEYINDEKLSSKEVVEMKVDALKILGHEDKAIKYLMPIIDSDRGSDALQLELVRMLILDNQKTVATPYLEDLVKEYPKNHDLLKSLIALEIDQNKLANARKNIVALGKSQSYKNDAFYFLAEVTEVEGDLKSALENYQKVKAGSLFENAKRGISRITKKLDKRNRLRVNYKLN